MTLPKLVILDRDGTLNVAAKPSETFKSPLFNILKSEHLILKPGVEEAIKIIEAHNIPVILATKQKCISKKIITRGKVDAINVKLQYKIDFWFNAIYVEENNFTKENLYRQILKDYSEINPCDCLLFDDSQEERDCAKSFGIITIDGSNLYKSVCETFGINP